MIQRRLKWNDREEGVDEEKSSTTFRQVKNNEKNDEETKASCIHIKTTTRKNYWNEDKRRPTGGDEKTRNIRRPSGR